MTTGKICAFPKDTQAVVIVNSSHNSDSNKGAGHGLSPWCLIKESRSLHWSVLWDFRFISLFVLEYISLDIKKPLNMKRHLYCEEIFVADLKRFQSFGLTSGFGIPYGETILLSSIKLAFSFLITTSCRGSQLVYPRIFEGVGGVRKNIEGAETVRRSDLLIYFCHSTLNCSKNSSKQQDLFLFSALAKFVLPTMTDTYDELLIKFRLNWELDCILCVWCLNGLL